MNDYKNKKGKSFLWSEEGKYIEQNWINLKNKILNTQGGIGIIADDFIEMLQYRSFPEKEKANLLRESFSEITMDATEKDDIIILADILSVIIRRPSETINEATLFIVKLKNKKTNDFDSERAALILNELYVINEKSAKVLSKKLSFCVESYDEPLINLLYKIKETKLLNRTLMHKLNPITVFISYAREDNSLAEKLRLDLESDFKIKAWKDSIDLLPGEKWDYKIKKAIKENDFVIICLSKKSISKTGYFQVEMKEAIRRQQYRPETKVYLIPVRFDKCDMPMEIEDYHCVELFKNWNKGVEEIIKSVKTYRN